MKIPPKKPHFFKPILPGFKHGLKIPIGFLKYLKGYENIKHAVLKRAGKKWWVKVKGRRLKRGWKKFAKEHDLQIGDLLIFRHEGEMEFDVSIFNISHCDREYAEYLQEEEKEAHTVEETSKEFKEVATHNPIGQSQFVCTVKQYYLTNGYLRVPNKFAKANGLINKKCGLIIRDERQRSWNLKLYTSCSQVHVGGRWGAFRVANDIKVGDQIIFEVVTNGEQPIWKFHEYLQEEEEEEEEEVDTVKETSKNFEFKEVTTHHPVGQSQFVCTVKQYFLTNGYLRIPNKFAKANGLINKECGLIIRDERQRSWNLRIYTFCSHVYIGGRWGKFHDANDIKVGDQIMFEVVTNGEQPIWKFHEYSQGQEAHIVEEAATHNPVGQSQFVCTVKQQFLTNGYLRIPGEFARGNGLINKKCDLIIRDEKRRSWNLKLYTSRSQVYIGGRWGKFYAANGIKVGDRIMFEVVTNGEQPIWKFHVVHYFSSSRWSIGNRFSISQGRECAEYLQEEEKEADTVEETSKNFEFKEAITHHPIRQSQFVCTVKQYYLTNGYLRIPNKFAKANGLTNKECGLIIRDERQRSWNLRIYTSCSNVYIGGRWGQFHAANDIKVGDQIMFEVVTNGEQPIWKFHDKPSPTIKSSSKAFPPVEAVTHKPFGHSRLVCTIRPYCLTYGYLFLPRQFAHANGLISKKCDLIIRDEWQRSWNLILRPFGTSVCIRGGWHKFRDTYCLKEGDRIMFEVVTDGQKPIWKFHGKISGDGVSIIGQ